MNEAQLRAEITQLERDRDSADTERECFAVRKAKELDERVETALKAQRDMNADYATQCAKHERTIGDLRVEREELNKCVDAQRKEVEETHKENAKLRHSLLGGDVALTDIFDRQEEEIAKLRAVVDAAQDFVDAEPEIAFVREGDGENKLAAPFANLKRALAAAEGKDE